MFYEKRIPPVFGPRAGLSSALGSLRQGCFLLSCAFLLISSLVVISLSAFFAAKLLVMTTGRGNKEGGTERTSANQHPGYQDLGETDI